MANVNHKTALTIHWCSVSGLFSSKTLPVTAPAPTPAHTHTLRQQVGFQSDAAVANTNASLTAAPKADIINANEVAVGLTALQESLEPEDPALRSFPSRLFNVEMDLAKQFQGFGSCQTVQEGTRKAWGT
ncbi:hypothetical protein GGX14DRAFT_389065 [Mycena pura]|uniref:Uncharacterized protein n=1 Tax=Mycena pura TaxID=153505 RepID=A0AAD6VSM7_9AGAR|nr:hypothetical protein GGX14DRAFT_389065 [Mycena pura]